MVNWIGQFFGKFCTVFLSKMKGLVSIPMYEYQVLNMGIRGKIKSLSNCSNISVNPGPSSTPTAFRIDLLGEAILQICNCDVADSLARCKEY